MTHTFRTGSWRKTKQTGKDHAHFLMNSTNVQRSIIHEACSQLLGHSPSTLWGHPIPPELLPDTDRSTLHFVREASKHSAHEFGRLISSHKTGGSFVSEFGSLVGSFGKTALKYGKTAGTFLIKLGDDIKTGIGIAKGLVQTGTSIAQLSGLIGEDRKTQLDSIANAINAHAQSDVYKSKPLKKGGRVRV